MNGFQVMTSCVWVEEGRGEWRLLEMRIWSRMSSFKSLARMGNVLGLLVIVV